MKREYVPWRAPFRHGRLRAAIAFAAVLATAPAVGYACDLCAIYSATETGQAQSGFRLGTAEQFTRYTTLQDGSEEVPNPYNERLNSSITQVLFGYQFTERLGAQINLPIISRTYRRVEDHGVVHGDETGIGDLSLIGNVLAYHTFTEQTVLRLSLIGGLKLPSGDPDRLKEERDDGHGHGSSTSPFPIPPRPVKRATAPPRAQHGSGEDSPVSGIHGHDLALGSGSVDGIIGAQGFASWHRAFVTASVQYLLRTEGDFDYEYANDFLWSAGPGLYLALGHDAGRDYSVGAQALLSGETKGNDTFEGAKLGDTSITALYIGPAFSFTWGTDLSADIGADLPVLQNNAGLQIVADYRLRGGITWRF